MFGYSRQPSRRTRASQQNKRSRFLQRCEALEPRLLLATTPVNSTIWDYNIIVRFEADATASEEAAALGSIGATPVTKFSGELDGMMVAKLPDADQNFTGLREALDELNSNPNVKYAQRNYVLTHNKVPNDLLFDEQWGLHSIGQGGTGGVPDADIDAPEVWDISTGSKSVIVAVIDTGVDYTHPDLRANIWRNQFEIAGDGVDNDGNGYVDDTVGIDTINFDSDPFDDDSHGTHVAGTIGAIGNNDIGVTGVNWNVRIMPLKFLGPAGGSTAGAIECINYVTNMKLRGENIVASNNSWGGGPFSQALLDAINSQGNVGTLFVAASGNGGPDGVGDDTDVAPEYPTSYGSPHIISVAATDRRDNLTAFSNYGQTTVDLAAPGAEILSTVPRTINQLGYEYFDGTSMASPHVTGAIALLASIDPTLTAAELKSIILAGVDPLPNLDTFVVTGGRLNVANSLRLVPLGSVQGTVYNDVNGNGLVEVGTDGPLSGITVYADVNRNGIRDPQERTTTTDFNGDYTLTRLPDPVGGIHIRVVEPPFYHITLPASGFYSVDFTTLNEVRTELNFALFGPPGEISGRKWLDVNGNGTIEAGDSPLANVWIYVDMNNDGRVAAGEPKAVTDANGFYRIANIPVGTYFLREILPAGQSASFPVGGEYLFTMTARGVLTGYDFFNSPAHDYGDAPNSYRTLLASNGPVHGFVAGYGLGTRVDADADGKPTPFAGGDDSTFTDDEDGVAIAGPASPGRTLNFTVSVMLPNFTPSGYLNAWMDFNGDGDFTDAGEKIVSGRQLGRGNHSFSINVPTFTPLGTAFLRFRYGQEANIGFGGRAVQGEVEDYAIKVLGPLPVANPDQAAVQQFSKNNVIDVLANDTRSVSGPIRIDASSFPATSVRGGKLVLDTNGTTNPSDDFVRYDAAPAPAGTGRTYTDSFQYTITDGVNEDTATVTITVTRVSTPARAVEDIFRVDTTGTSTLFGMLNNDIPGTDRGVPYTKVSLYSFDTQVKDESGAVIGTLVRNNRGTTSDLADDLLVFTPAAGAAGKTGQFQYIVRNPDVSNPAVNSNKATVTLQVRNNNGPDGNDIVKLSLEVRDTNANGGLGVIPTQLVQGNRYWVGILADDLRGEFAYQDRPGVNANGALSVYLDLLFDRKYVSPVRVTKTASNPSGLRIVYQEPYRTDNTGRSGDANSTGLINELGVTAATEEEIGPENKRVLYIQFTATNVTPGTSGLVLWKTDPADQRSSIDPSFTHDVTVVNRTDTTQLDELPLTNITYLGARSYRIVAASSAAAPSTTAAMTTTSSSTPTPTAPQEPVITSSTPTKTYSAYDAALAAMFTDDDDPYKKR